MFELTAETERLAREIFELVLARQRMDPMPLGRIGERDTLQRALGGSIEIRPVNEAIKFNTENSRAVATA